MKGVRLENGAVGLSLIPREEPPKWGLRPLGPAPSRFPNGGGRFPIVFDPRGIDILDKGPPLSINVELSSLNGTSGPLPSRESAPTK